MKRMRRQADGPAPAPRQGPRGRPDGGSRLADVALAVALFGLMLVVEPGADDDLALRSIGDVPVGEVVLAAAACTALLRRRSHPLPVLGATVGAAIVAQVTGLSDLVGVSAFVGLYSVGRYVADDRWSGGSLATVLAMVVGSTLADHDAALPDVGFGMTLTLIVWYAGRRLRARDEDARRRSHEQAAEARRAIAEERTRIARELHDVVAHRVSIMTVQAGAARTVAASDPHQAAQAMHAVEQAGRQALDELRHLLGVLRPAADGPALAPQPGLDDVRGLVERFRAAGLQVSLSIEGTPVDLPARVEVSSYRIVQESLTNALRHAGPGTRARVSIACREDGVDVTVSDDGHAGGGAPGSGHGIIGMRERAQLLGGDLEAAARPGGGFRVRAHLPNRGQHP